MWKSEFKQNYCAEDFFGLKIRWLRPGLNPQTWVLKARTPPLDHRNRQNPLYSTWNLSMYYAVSRSSSLWCLFSLLFLVNTNISKGYQLKSMEVTLQSPHTPSLLPSNEVSSTSWPDNIWDTSDQSSFSGGYKSWVDWQLWLCSYVTFLSRNMQQLGAVPYNRPRHWHTILCSL